MKTLSQLFEKYSHQLKQSIEEDPNPKEVVQETQNFLTTLFAEYRAQEAQDLDRATLVELTKDLMKDLLKSAPFTLKAASEATEVNRRHAGQSTPSHQEGPRSSSRTATNQGLAGLRGRLEKALGRSGQPPLREESDTPKSAPAYSGTPAGQPAYTQDVPGQMAPFELQVDVDAFLGKLADAFADADNLLSAVERMVEKVPEPGPQLEDDPDLLGLLQDLLEAEETKDSRYALDVARNVPYILRRYDVKIEYFKDGNEYLFDSVPSLDPEAQKSMTLRAALVKDDALLKRGLVAEPTSEGRSDGQ